jgi:hypothetical protein
VFADTRRRKKWLDGLELEITTATKPKSMRMRIGDGSRADVYFTPKGAAKCAVAIQHRALPDSAAKDRLGTFWAERLERLKALIEGT